MAGSERGKWCRTTVHEAKGAPRLLLIGLKGVGTVLLTPWPRGRRLTAEQQEEAEAVAERAAVVAGELRGLAAWIDGERVTPFRPESGSWVMRRLTDFAAVRVPIGPDQPSSIARSRAVGGAGVPSA